MYQRALRHIVDAFPAYLQGMETKTKATLVSPFISVPSLPTRNGNALLNRCDLLFVARSQPTYKEWKHTSACWNTAVNVRSQPTYKEWKLISFAPCSTAARSVPSLPTRNGNGSPPSWLHMQPPGSQPTYKEWKRNPAPPAPPRGYRVPSLPTRNGNCFRPARRGACAGVPSLPTRNGNLYRVKEAPRPGKGSQPTYKEWKLPAHTVFPSAAALFPAYLQGMETLV